MPVAINMPSRPQNQEKDPIEKLANAVSIAKNIYGIYADSKTLDQALADKKADKEKRDLELDKLRRESQDAQADAATSGPLVDAIRAQVEKRGGTLPAGITLKQAKTVFDAYMKPPPEKDPLARALLDEQLDEKRRKREEDDAEKQTPYGKALTKDDAKQIKEAHVLKQKLDSEIGELIQLRETYGAEAWNREAVARGKQLSKSLLLTKKNLENLGVLSQSDRDIIDAIIPSDPLEFNVMAPAGQDPTMTKLKAFKEDTQRDFTAKLDARLKGGVQSTAGQQPPKKPDDKLNALMQERQLRKQTAGR